MSEGYCFKCKTKKEISEGVELTTKNGRKAIKGKCAVCGSGMFKWLSNSVATTVTHTTNPPPPTV